MDVKPPVPSGEPKFDELADPKRAWVGAAGSSEEGLGRLALLTWDCVREASQEIVTGQRVGLNWDMKKLEFPGYGRICCNHKVVPLLDGEAFDDEYTLNPQQSSQWDGLRHWSIASAHDPQQREWYGGTTRSEILSPLNNRIGIQHWAREGITGRAILIDYVSWAEKEGVEYSTFSRHTIKLQDILAIAAESKVTFKRGDVLLVRGGMIREWEQKMDVEAKKAYAAQESPYHAGVEATIDVLRWIWNTGFAAVAGDMISFEVFPPTGDICLHDYFLAGWGMPIGEMFDLERLAEVCKRQNRWSFFFASMPFNMQGGVSSPPNAQAIF